MKNQILALSTDERNFLRDPPAGVPFHYENDSMFPVALATLQEDTNLSKMRFHECSQFILIILYYQISSQFNLIMYK